MSNQASHIIKEDSSYPETHLSGLRRLADATADGSTVSVLSSDDLSSIEDQRLYQLIPTYVYVFGEEPWNEGAINIDNEGDVIPLSLYMDLSPEEKLKYRLYYDPESLIERFRQEFSSGGQAQFLITLDKEDLVLGMAWGGFSDLQAVISRIGLANYSYNTDVEARWITGVSKGLSARLKEIFSPEQVQICYVDEILLIPAARGKSSRQLFSRMMDTILELSEKVDSSEKGLNVFFRTSLDEKSRMGQIAKGLFVGSGLFREVRVPGDVENIAYFVGHIPSHILKEMQEVSPYSYMYAKAKENLGGA